MPRFEGGEKFLRERCSRASLSFVYCEHSSKDLFFAYRDTVRRGFDLVHCHGFTAGALVGLGRPLRHMTPHLMTVHDVFLERQFSGWKGRFKKFLLSLTFRRMDAIHVVSEDCKANFLEFFPKIEDFRIYTILHGVDTEKFYNEEPRDFREELGFSDQLLLGFFGRFMAQKGFKYIVEAIEFLITKDERYRRRLKVLTFGWGGFIREEFELIEQKGLSDIFVQMPHTDNMPAAIKGVDVVLMPSLWEACGLLGMEALAAGTPIIGTNCIGLREVLEDSPAFIVPPKDGHVLSRAIESCLVERNKDSFDSYAEIAVKRFSLDIPAESLEHLYSKMIDGSL
ncbi:MULTISPECIES: glycosyltransferase family 4 protein [unclassified Oleiphilus]|nr:MULTISPECIES: glycosyltransferase family 4 protein [unclassified Oleiphilus]